MAKYVLEFSKTGVICYISHLDMMRVFHRAFKRAAIDLEYSHGFNPHPKMVFAQPLSLGYRGLHEYLEFEIKEEMDAGELMEELRRLMPDGLDLMECRRLELPRKTLAAITDAAAYTAVIPVRTMPQEDCDDMRDSYLSQERITVMKKQKKKKELKEIDIKPMIRELTFKKDKEDGEDVLIAEMLLDQGSISNLSPEHVISTVTGYFATGTDRSEVTVTRTKIYFADGYEI